MPSNSKIYTRIADVMYFIGLQNCISCAFLLPLASYARKNSMISEVRIMLHNTKTEYRERLIPALIPFEMNVDNVHPPAIVMINSGFLGLVDPGIVQECAHEIQRFFESDSDSMLDYLEEEFEESVLFQRLLQRLSMNLIPGEGKLVLDEFDDYRDY